MAAQSQSALSARLGESTTAYSSPSKDINTINGHLTGKRYPFQLTSSAPGSNIVLQGLDSNAVRLHIRYHVVVPVPALRTLFSERESARHSLSFVSEICPLWHSSRPAASPGITSGWSQAQHKASPDTSLSYCGALQSPAACDVTFDLKFQRIAALLHL